MILSGFNSGAPSVGAGLAATLDEQRSFCCPCALGQGPEAGAVTTAVSSSGASTSRSIMLGVITGVSIWFITRHLDALMRRDRT